MSDRSALRALVDEIVERGQRLQAMIGDGGVGAAEPEPEPEHAIRVDGPGTEAIKRAIGAACEAAQHRPVVVTIAPGQYVERVEFPRHGGKPITVTADPASLPPRGTRIAPGRALPQLGSPDGGTPLWIRGDDYAIRGLEVIAPKVGTTHVEVGSDVETDATKQPARVRFEQVLIRGHESLGGHRGISMNGRDVAVVDSWIDRMAEIGRDSQALAAFNTPGPLHVENCFLQASGENFMLGGTRAYVGAVPADVTFYRNLVHKDPAWRTWASVPSVKNSLELKFARRVQIRGNVFDNNWAGAQTGWAILFTTKKNTTTAAPWCEIADVDFAGNVIRNTSSGVNISAEEGPCARIRIVDNVWDTLDRRFGGDGKFAQIAAGVADITIARNTVLGMTGAAFLTLYGTGSIPRLVVTHNALVEAAYGVHATGGIGAVALAAFGLDGEFRDNAIVDDPRRKILWPPGNVLLPIGTDLRASFDPITYALIPGSPVAEVHTSDGIPIGAHPAALRDALAVLV